MKRLQEPPVSGSAEGLVVAEVARGGGGVALQARPLVVRGCQCVQEMFERIEIASVAAARASSTRWLRGM